MTTNTMLRSKGGVRSRLMAVMSYLGILCFIPLLRNADDEYVHFHAKQGLVIWMLGVIGVFSLYIPGVGKTIFIVSATAVVIFSVIGIISAALNRAWKLPFICTVSDHI